MTPTPLTVGQVAVLLGVHPNTLRRWSPAHLPFFRIGTRGDRRYDADVVTKYRQVKEAR